MKEVLAEARVPTARYGAFDDIRAATGLPARAARAVGGEDRRARRGQGRARHRFARGGRGRRRRQALGGGLRRSRPACGGRRRARGARVLAARALRRDSRRCHWRRRRTSSASATATRGPTPVAWARTRRCRWSTTDSSTGVLDKAVEPLVGALRRRGIDYRGVLYAGLILTAEGPKVLEYNVRFGDPETQVVIAPAHRGPHRAPGRGGLRAACAPSRAAPRAHRCAWCSPPRDTPARRAPGTASTGSTRPPPWRA